MRGNGPSHRRRFLAGIAATGSAALAGCSALSRNDDTGPTFTAADAAGIITDATPEIERPVPVVPTSNALEAGLERVDTLLAAVPDPIKADTVPNGVVRQSINDHRDEARNSRNEAAAATGDDRYRALQTMQDAREAARAATTTLDAIGTEAKPIVADLREERNAVHSKVSDRLGSIVYRGGGGDEELLRAALFYARQESVLWGATGQLDRNRWEIDENATVIEIGDRAGALESAAATTAVWDHLQDRFVEQTDDSTDLTAAFETALEASVERVTSVDVPDRSGEDWPDGVVDGGLDDQRLEQMLWRAAEPVRGPKNALGPVHDTVRNGYTAAGLYEAVWFEAHYRAFERVCERISDGTLAAPESIDEIRAERTAALEAAASADEALSGPTIGAYVLAETLRSLRWADDAIRRSADNRPDVGVSLTSEYGDYARLRAQFEVLPNAVEAFRERLPEV